MWPLRLLFRVMRRQWPDQQQKNDKDKYKKSKDKDKRRTSSKNKLVTFETLIILLTIENNTFNIHSDPWIKSDRDSIRNSCDVCVAITVFSQGSLAMSLRDKQKYSLIIHGIHFGRKGKKSALTIILWDNLVPRSDVNVLNHLVLENDL